MLFYIAFASFFFMLAAAEKRLQSDSGAAFWCLSFVLLVLFDGMRWQTGTDWNSYLYYFQGCLNSQNDLDALFEPGYIAINQAVRSVTEHYTVLLTILAIITYSGFFLFIRRYSPLPFLSLFLLFVTMLPYQGMNRQYIAIVICLSGIPFLLKQQNWRFVFCVFFAMLFHTTAIFFLLAFFLKKRYSLKFYYYLMGSAALLCISGVMGRVSALSLNVLGGAIGYRLALYSSGGIFESSFFSRTMGVAMRALFIVPVLFAMHKKVRLPDNAVFIFNMYLMGALFYCLFTGTILQVLVARGMLYFSIFQIILIPYILLLYRKAFSKQTLLAFLYVYFVFLMVRGIHNYDEGEYNPFIPYTTVNCDFNLNLRKGLIYSSNQ